MPDAHRDAINIICNQTFRMFPSFHKLHFFISMNFLKLVPKTKTYNQQATLCISHSIGNLWLMEDRHCSDRAPAVVQWHIIRHRVGGLGHKHFLAENFQEY